MTLQDVLDRLEGVKRNVDRYTARCPAHHDSNPSLSVSVGNDGRILLHCFAGCSTEDVTEAIGLSMKDLFAEVTPAAAFPAYPPSGSPDGPIKEAEYIYAGGALKKIKMRKPDGGKYCYWQHLDGNKWKKGRGSVAPGLYQSQPDLPEIFFLVEGEKDVDNLKRAGMVAVSLPDGAQSKWEAAYNDVFRDKQVIIIPDNDDPGKKYASMCAEKSYSAGAAVKLLNLADIWPEMPQKADVSDLIMQFGQPEAMSMIIKLTNDAAPWEPKQAATEDKPKKPALIRASAVPYDPPRWTIAPYFQRGKGTLIQGDNGSGKTAFMCAIAAHVTTGAPLLGLPIDTPGDVLMLSVEDDLPVLRGRIEASGGNLDRVSFMTNAAGLTFNSPEVEAAIKEIHAKMVIFDPFQAFLGGGVDMFRPNETRPELAKLFEMCERNDCSCAIIAHMGKSGGDKSAVNRALGSVDIPAAMRSILQLSENPDDETQKVMVHVKCSNAPRGSSIAYTIGDRGGVSWVGFSPMTIEDLSIIKKRKERGVDYEHDPLVQVFNQLVTNNHGGGFWSYSDLKSEGAKILGFPPFDNVGDLRKKLDTGLARELQKHDGLIVTHSVRGAHNVRGVRVEWYTVPDSYQTVISES